MVSRALRTCSFYLRFTIYDSRPQGCLRLKSSTSGSHRRRCTQRLLQRLSSNSWFEFLVRWFVQKRRSRCRLKPRRLPIRRASCRCNGGSPTPALQRQGPCNHFRLAEIRRRALSASLSFAPERQPRPWSFQVPRRLRAMPNQPAHYSQQT